MKRIAVPQLPLDLGLEEPEPKPAVRSQLVDQAYESLATAIEAHGNEYLSIKALAETELEMEEDAVFDPENEARWVLRDGDGKVNLYHRDFVVDVTFHQIYRLTIVQPGERRTRKWELIRRSEAPPYARPRLSVVL